VDSLIVPFTVIEKDFGENASELDRETIENVVSSAKHLMPHMSADDEENIRIQAIIDLLKVKLERMTGVPIEINLKENE